MRARRLLRLALAALLLVGQPAGARELPALPFTPVVFTLTDEDPCRPGGVRTEGNGNRLPERSPAPSVVPVHYNLNPAPSAWGLGWHEASDATLQVQGDGSVAWVDGTGPSAPSRPSSGRTWTSRTPLCWISPSTARPPPRPRRSSTGARLPTSSP